ncbi:uncharacterized protein MELLADRAFT_112742 [Melampsora larici-populina 98AG31]|uniref:C2 domain-containing protein n=1 Tax=Melampsora larici-populina (strain 98AG31 / pathotype 3-4-7) TaxID=747676 RepID=F4S7G0_MELLP|nr:uncharacterized protein MELLADRAFT_112742 [Melampsora larici-populina 98AG31]EGF99433.1 hypothetical protein MELLADRAFT_112742 [Melampsora larici-populina 98AG31]
MAVIDSTPEEKKQQAILGADKLAELDMRHLHLKPTATTDKTFDKLIKLNYHLIALKIDLNGIKVEVLSPSIVASVDQILVASTPTVSGSTRMLTFTLGSKGRRIDSIRTHPKTEDDVVVMNDILEMTAKDAAAKINFKIVLIIRFGKGLIGAAKDIIIENISFCGIIWILIKLMNSFPHLQLVDLYFLEVPEFYFVLITVGFDLNTIPGISGFIESQVQHATLGPMMQVVFSILAYDPNVSTLNLEPMLAGTPIDSAIRVIQLTVHHARGLRAVKIGGGTPDPYMTILIGARGHLDCIKVKNSTQNLHWNSTPLSPSQLSQQLSHTGNHGLQQMGEEEPMPESTTTGVVRLTLHQAKELDYKQSGTSQLSPCAKIYLNGIQLKKTFVIK